MPKYRIKAEAIGYLEEIIEADNEERAWEILEEKLEQGALPEVDGSIDFKQVEEVE